MRNERGQASVELVAVLPALVVAILVAAQLAVAGHALWFAGLAARAGARANLVGRSATQAARSALPDQLRAGSLIDEDEGRLSVRVRVPRLLPGMPRLRIEGVARDGRV